MTEQQVTTLLATLRSVLANAAAVRRALDHPLHSVGRRRAIQLLDDVNRYGVDVELVAEVLRRWSQVYALIQGIDGGVEFNRAMARAAEAFTQIQVNNGAAPLEEHTFPPSPELLEAINRHANIAQITALMTRELPVPPEQEQPATPTNEALPGTLTAAPNWDAVTGVNRPVWLTNMPRTTPTLDGTGVVDLNEVDRFLGTIEPIQLAQPPETVLPNLMQFTHGMMIQRNPLMAADGVPPSVGDMLIHNRTTAVFTGGTWIAQTFETANDFFDSIHEAQTARGGHIRVYNYPTRRVQYWSHSDEEGWVRQPDPAPRTPTEVGGDVAMMVTEPDGTRRLTGRVPAQPRFSAFNHHTAVIQHRVVTHTEMMITHGYPADRWDHHPVPVDGQLMLDRNSVAVFRTGRWEVTLCDSPRHWLETIRSFQHDPDWTVDVYDYNICRVEKWRLTAEGEWVFHSRAIPVANMATAPEPTPDLNQVDRIINNRDAQELASITTDLGGDLPTVIFSVTITHEAIVARYLDIDSELPRPMDGEICVMSRNQHSSTYVYRNGAWVLGSSGAYNEGSELNLYIYPSGRRVRVRFTGGHWAMVTGTPRLVSDPESFGI